MRHVTIYIPDENYAQFMELTKNIEYIEKITTDEDSKKEKIIKNIKNGLEEVNLFKKGKLKTTSAKDFLDEL